MTYIDMINCGDQINEWTYLYPIKIDGKTKLHCVCSCGKEQNIAPVDLIKERTKSCGCKKGIFISQNGKLDLKGDVYGRLTVLERLETPNNKFRCLCECGNETIVSIGALRSGHTQSCGCLVTEKTTKKNTTHGLSHTILYNRYCGIKSRCYNKNDKSYKYYGEKGIKMCDTWLNSFDKFYEWSINNGFKDNLTIERKDPTKDYCPENCEWITQNENSRRKNEYYRNKKESNDERNNISG